MNSTHIISMMDIYLQAVGFTPDFHYPDDCGFGNTGDFISLVKKK